jgi:hypothetical protein
VVREPHAIGAAKLSRHLGDDVGYCNVSAYNQGMMGYQTPEYRQSTNK